MAKDSKSLKKIKVKKLTILPSEIIRDDVEDIVGEYCKKLYECKRNTTQFKNTKKAVINSLKNIEAIFFEGDNRAYQLGCTGESFLYHVPMKKRGHLKPLRGKFIRLVCIGSGYRRQRLLAAHIVLKIPSELALIRDQLIDSAFGRGNIWPKEEDMEKLVDWEWLNTTNYADCNEFVNPSLEFFFSDEALKDDLEVDTKLTDQARIEFIRKIIEDEELEHQTFTLELKNKNNEVAYLCGWQTGWSWTFYGSYKSPEDFQANIQADKFLCKGYELSLLSDDELLSLWDKTSK